MPRQFRTNAARQIVEQAGSDAVELVAELAEPLAEYLLDDYEREDWQDSPHIEALARVAALLEAQGRAPHPNFNGSEKKAPRLSGGLNRGPLERG
jgi:hypothetical protein